MAQESDDKAGEHPEKKVHLTVVVNGKPETVNAEEDTRLVAVEETALNESGNKGQPPQNWILTNEQGQELDVQKTVADYHLSSTTKLFLSPRAGVGGT